MVGMRVGVEDPHRLQPLPGYMVEQPVSVAGRRRAGLLVEVEDRIDDRAFSRRRVGDDILD
jgi:hypothetical protein